MIDREGSKRSGRHEEGTESRGRDRNKTKGKEKQREWEGMGVKRKDRG